MALISGFRARCRGPRLVNRCVREFYGECLCRGVVEAHKCEPGAGGRLAIVHKKKGKKKKRKRKEKGKRKERERKEREREERTMAGRLERDNWEKKWQFQNSGDESTDPVCMNRSISRE